jgi:hypothetical protein
MSPEAHFIHRLGLASASICLAASLLILTAAGDFSAESCESYMMARSLIETAAAVLLVAVIGEVCVEERTSA